MSVYNSLIEEFYSLKNGDIPQCKKKINIYISTLRTQLTNEKDIADFFDMINCKTEIEQLFKLDIAIAFGRNDFILQTLKGGDVRYIRKILNNSRFLRTTFTALSAEQLMSDILPHLSYCVKLKLLNKLTAVLKRNELSQDLYIALEQKYGHLLAMSVLPGCSSEFIKTKLTESNRLLTERQLYFITKENPTFLREYLKILQDKDKSKSLPTYAKILKYLANTDPELFWSIQEEFHFDVKLGRSQTKNVLKNNLEKLRIGEKHIRILHRDTIYKTLKKNRILDEFLMTFLPEESKNAEVCLRKDHPFIKFIQRHFQSQDTWKIIKEIYERKYGHDFFKEIPDIDEDIATMILKDETDGKKIMDFITEKDYKSLQSTEIAIPALKERLKSTEIDDAEDIENVAVIIKSMFENCALNCDKRAFEEVLEYIFCKFRYEVNIIRELFGMIADWPYFDEFTPSMWAIVDAFFQRHKQRPYLMNNHLPFYFNHLVESGMPIEIYFESVVACLHMTPNETNPFKKRKYEKLALETFGNTLEPLCESNLYGHMCMKYTQWVLDYNKRFPTDRVFITKYPNIIKFFSASLYDEATDILYDCLNEFEDFEQFDIALWRNFNLRVKANILIWYKRYHPERLIDNKEKVFEEIDYNVEAFLTNLRRYPQAEIISAYKDHAAKVVKELNYSQAPFAVLFLATLSRDEFYNLAKTLVPSPDGKMHYGTSYEKVNLQKAVTRGLKIVGYTETTLTLIKQYCVGKYVKYCADVFTSICAKTPEIILTSYLNEMHEFTVRKHVMGAMKSFLFKHNIIKAIPAPAELKPKQLLATLRAMPRENHFQYLRDVCNVQGAVDFSEVLTKLTEEEIKEWDVELLQYLMEQTAVPPDFHCYESEFQCICVFGNTGVRRSQLFEFAMNVFTKYVDGNRDKFLVDELFHRTATFFILSFCKNSLKSQESKDIIFELLAKCATIFEPELLISPYLVLEFTALYFESDQNLKELGRKTNTLLSRYIEKYGASVIDVFHDRLESFINIRESSLEDRIDLLKGLLENFNVDAAVLALHLLPEYSHYKYNDEGKCTGYDEIFEVLIKCREPTIRFFLQFKNTPYYT